MAPVSRRSRRIQAAVDSGAALVIAMLAWPFPLARAVLPVWLDVVLLLVFWQLVQVGYCAVTAGVWGSTAGTWTQGVELATAEGDEPTRRQRAQWGAVTGAVALAHVALPPRETAVTLAERLSGVTVRTAQH